MKQMYPSLTEMAQELERQNAAKVDYLVPTDKIHFVTTATNSDIELLGTDIGGLDSLTVNDVAHGQIADKLGIPTRYYNRLRDEYPSLLDENVNRLLRFRPDPSKPYDQWMVRTLDGTARACLSDRYRRLDNYQIAATVLPILQQLPGVKIKSSALTDTRMHIKAITSIEAQVQGSRRGVGDIVASGVYVGNSEVGHGSVRIYPFVEALICTNGMVVERKGLGMMKQVHLGRTVEADGLGRIFRDETLAAEDQAFLMKLADVVRAATDEAMFHELVAEMSRATQTTGLGDINAAVTVMAQRENLTKDEEKSIVQHLAEGGDLSQWGLVNAITRAAEDAESYDRATELETIGSHVLTYVPREWEALATA